MNKWMNEWMNEKWVSECTHPLPCSRKLLLHISILMVWSKREILPFWRQTKRSKIFKTEKATPIKLGVHAFHINLYLHKYFDFWVDSLSPDCPSSASFIPHTSWTNLWSYERLTYTIVGELGLLYNGTPNGEEATTCNLTTPTTDYLQYYIS